MGWKLAVVCEGSNDFRVLRRLVSKICEENGIELELFECIQPKISATFYQSDSGGWARVKAWCEQSAGKFYQTFLKAPIFEQSTVYDAIIIHIDGDVLDHCTAPPLAGMVSAGLDADQIVTILRDAVLGAWMRPSDEDVGKLVPCVPVLHLEAWLLAALTEEVTDLESRSTKAEFDEHARPVYITSQGEMYDQVAALAAQSLRVVREKCKSFACFEEDLIRSSAI